MFRLPVLLADWVRASHKFSALEYRRVVSAAARCVLVVAFDACHRALTSMVQNT